MKRIAGVVCGVGLMGLSSCGGGGSSSAPPPSGAVTPTLNVSLSENSGSVTVAEGDVATLGFNATFTGSSNDPIVADIQIDGDQFELANEVTQSGNAFSVNITSRRFLPAQEGEARITFRLCTSSSCSTVYPGSTRTYTVSFDFNLNDWEQFQRDADHTGYVPVRYDPDRFAFAWDYTDTFPDGRVRPSAATEGIVYTTFARNGGSAYDGTARVIAFDSADGSIIDTFDFGDQFHISGPSLSGNGLHFAATELGGQDGIWVLNRENLSFRDLLAFEVQFVDFEQPSIEGERIYFSGGDQGGQTWSFDAAAGTTLWRSFSDNFGIWGGQVLSYDENSIYNYRGSVLEVLDKATGTLTATVADPAFEVGLDYEAATVPDGEGRLLLFSGDKRFLGSNQLIAISLENLNILWRTTAQYSTAFALRDGIIYAVRQDARVLSAINAADGSVLWSTRLPETPNQFGEDPLVGNVIVTENLAFASSASKTWAIDIEDPEHPIVWEADTGGRLTLTPDNLLLTTNVPFDAKLTAYRLN
ncbi:outer membrane protein assembly factor BamB family protein [Aurantiacibacter sp. MUD61]|uniref:outer membrane protein assembly factor BamB family protein n=1 Tax=Aurantiacibacter sp. MUD61 TaxID=3009083 RepID=UPI0022F0D25B|nr:PQQ-binding-like beta-propeller repeat protein [Aurantiacibacter sp. MUD61]